MFLTSTFTVVTFEFCQLVVISCRGVHSLQWWHHSICLLLLSLSWLKFLSRILIFMWLLSMLLVFNFSHFISIISVFCKFWFAFHVYEISPTFFETGYKIPVGLSYLEIVAFVQITLYTPFLSYLLDFFHFIAYYVI